MDLLIVDDNPTDTMVLQTRLRRAFPKAEILVAERRIDSETASSAPTTTS